MIRARTILKASLLASAVGFCLSAPIASAVIISATEDEDLLANTLIIPNTGVTLLNFALNEDTQNLDNGLVASDGNETSKEESSSQSTDDDTAGKETESTLALGEIQTLDELTQTLDSEGLLGFAGVGFEADFGDSSTELNYQTGIFSDNNGVFGLANTNGLAFNINGFRGGNIDSSTGVAGITGVPVEINQPAQSQTQQNESFSSITGQQALFEPAQLDITFDVNDDVYGISFVGILLDDGQSGGASLLDRLSVVFNDTPVQGVVEQSGATSGSAETPTSSPESTTASEQSPTNAATENGGNSEPTQTVATVTGNSQGNDEPDTATQSEEQTSNEQSSETAANVVERIRFDVPVEPGSQGNTLSISIDDGESGSDGGTILLSSIETAGLGETEFMPILPDPENPTNEDGDFVLVIPEVEAFETIFIDPDIATGYTYTATSNDPDIPALFASVTAPSPAVVNDPDGFILTYIDENGVEQMRGLAPSETFTFPVPIETFSITGIDPNLGLDPTQSGLFTTGVSFSENAPAETFDVLQRPIIEDHTDISEPGSLALIGLSLFATFAYRRRTQVK